MYLYYAMHINIFYSFSFCIDSKKWISHPQFENHVVGNRTDLNNEARKCDGLKRPAAHLRACAASKFFCSYLHCRV